MTTGETGADRRELILTRIIDAPPEQVFRGWTDPDLVKQWFAPKPWSIAEAELDVRPGGRMMMVMCDPDGNEFPNEGVYLEVVPNERLVFTDAYSQGWVPSGNPFMTAILSFEEEAGGSKTRYTARVRHWSEESREKHEAMGFQQGWNQCADQLEKLLKSG